MDLIETIRNLFTKKTGINPIDMDALLISKGCTIVPFTTFLSNPTQPILNTTNVDEYLKFIDVYVTCYKPVFIFKQPAGTGSFNYYTLNNYFGLKITVYTTNTGKK